MAGSHPFCPGTALSSPAPDGSRVLLLPELACGLLHEVLDGGDGLVPVKNRRLDRPPDRNPDGRPLEKAIAFLADELLVTGTSSRKSRVPSRPTEPLIAISASPTRSLTGVQVTRPCRPLQDNSLSSQADFFLFQAKQNQNLAQNVTALQGKVAADPSPSQRLPPCHGLP